DSHCRLPRRAIYCPSEDEVLHEQGARAILHGDIEAARRCFETAKRCFEAATKGHNYIGKAPRSSKKPKPTLHLPAPNVSSVDLDSRYSKK
ncbi:hypothetical protein A2U01_0048928, partial [Trifolium medium]|nr:hypothetical protein [Trifolium medium]